MIKKAVRLFGYALGGLCVLAVGIWVLSLTLGTHDEAFNGKPAYYWSDQMTNSDAAVSNRACAVLYGQILPRLTNQMFSDTHDSKLRMALVDQLNHLPGIQIDYLVAEGRRVQAASQLGSFGPPARPAIPALLTALKDKNDTMCSVAARALVQVGTEAGVAIPALTNCLVDDRGHGRSDVVDALATYGAQSKGAVPILIKLLKDRSSKEIITAVPAALKKIDPEAAAQAGVK